jgi:hypothetical protein
VTDARVSRRSLFITAGAGMLGVAVLGGCAAPEPAPVPPPSTAPPSPATIGAWKQVNMQYVSAYPLVRGCGLAADGRLDPEWGASWRAGT